MLICVETVQHVTVEVTERKTQQDQEGPEERADFRKCPAGMGAGLFSGRHAFVT